MNSYNLEKRVSNSKFSVNKKFLYFLIAPFLLILVGAIILCTAGYNVGTDFTGGTTFRMYINNGEDIISTEQTYDLDDKDDYNTVYGKIQSVLNDNGLTISSSRKTGMDIYFSDSNIPIVNGQAIEITYQNNTTNKEQIELQNQTIKSAIIAEFGLESYEEVVSSFDLTYSTASTQWITSLVCAIVVAFAVATIYIMARFGASASLVGVMMLAFDIFGTLSLLLICQIPVNKTIGIILLVALIASLVNLLGFYSKAKEGYKVGRFEKKRNSEVSDAIARETIFPRTMIYILFAVMTLVFVIASVSAVSFVALGILLALIMTYYNSSFILPCFFATLYKQKKKKGQLK